MLFKFQIYSLQETIIYDSHPPRSVAFYTTIFYTSLNACLPIPESTMVVYLRSLQQKHLALGYTELNTNGQRNTNRMALSNAQKLLANKMRTQIQMVFLVFQIQNRRKHQSLYRKLKKKHLKESWKRKSPTVCLNSWLNGLCNKRSFSAKQTFIAHCSSQLMIQL